MRSGLRMRRMRGRELRKLKPTGPVAIKHVKELSDLCVCHVVIAEREQGPPELVARDRPVRVRVPVTEEVDHAHLVRVRVRVRVRMTGLRLTSP